MGQAYKEIINDQNCPFDMRKEILYWIYSSVSRWCKTVIITFSVALLIYLLFLCVCVAFDRLVILKCLE